VAAGGDPAPLFELEISRMTASSYIIDLRAKIGNQLLLLPSVAAVIHDGDGSLLLQQKAGSEGWSLPAGGIEPGETPQEAIRREVLEETGKTVLSERLLDVLGGKDFRYTYPNGHQVEYTVALFRCEIDSRDSYPLDNETVALRFFAKADMPKLGLPYPEDLLFRYD
jgi:8-oxo-dGTP pyrophosphatase MutT (NUDIX family)